MDLIDELALLRTYYVASECEHLRGEFIFRELPIPCLFFKSGLFIFFMLLYNNSTIASIPLYLCALCELHPILLL